MDEKTTTKNNAGNAKRVRHELHDENGRFAKGNKGGPGCPYASKVAVFRRELFNTVTAADVGDVTASVVEHAKAGSIRHQQLFFDVLGLRIKQVELMDNRDILKTYLGLKTEEV